MFFASCRYSGFRGKAASGGYLLRQRQTWICLSTVAGSSPSSTTTTTNSRITKTLYRQLLRWCKEAPKVPLTTLVPPVHLEPPNNVDAFRLEVLAMPPSNLDDAVVSKVRNILPSQAEIERKQMTIPIHQVKDVRNIIRAVFRLNDSHENSAPEHLKHRLSATFTALKSLNELSGGLESIQEQRKKHMDRTNVEFLIGQVVQHQEERWRGVIASWSRLDGSSEPAQRTSLTNKDYSDEANSMIAYDVILDAGDAHGMGSSSGWSRASQSDLKLVEDTALQHVNSSLIKDYFTKFNASKKRFVPNELVAYQFPTDKVEDITISSLSVAHGKLCLDMVAAAQELAARLERCILDETSCPGDRGLGMLGNVLGRLQGIAKGDVFSSKERYMQLDDSPTTAVSHHLTALLNVQLEVVDVNHQRRLCKEHKPRIKFSLGDVVKHKVYGFRGVVITWDPTPVMDVRRWDGLKHVENPMQKPFYQIVPDQNDCIQAFGAERSIRYVCEENLELCSEIDRNSMVVDMDTNWNRTDSGYEAPNSYKYRFGEDLDDDGITERCMTRIQDELNSLYLLAREPNPSEPLAAKLSMQRLLEFLQVVDNASDANPVQETIKEMRKAHPRRDLRWRLETGVSETLSGRGENAMEIYRLVLAEDSRYAEAWNKLATTQYMYGQPEDSLKSTKKVLEMDPTHLQAIIGLGLIHFEKEEYLEAVKCFREAIAIDPWIPIGSKLSMTLDLLDRIIVREEILD